MECAPHRMWKKLMALVLSLVMMAVMLPGALAVDLNVDAGFYFKQSRGGTCTLASAAMMLRRRAFLDGLTDWTDVTENSVRGSAWSGGLAHSFNYNAMQVGYATLPSGTEAKKQTLIQLLAEHPEGIVLYDRSRPHAVLLTDYTDGVFYCSDRPGAFRWAACPSRRQASPSRGRPATGTSPRIRIVSRPRRTAFVWKGCTTRSTSAPERA